MARDRDIAIIGMAGRFADATTLDQLHHNLRNGIDSIRDLTEERIAATTLPPDAKYRRAGYLRDVDKFDHQSFNIAKGEAQDMDPIVRLLLEVVNETFENSGYGPEHFAGQRCAVFIGDASTEYYKHADGFRETLITGNSPSFFATRISKQFNLTGNAQMVNTACSSSHVALHMAINELLLEEADHALVCGANLYLFPFYDNKNEMDIWSHDGKSRAFSAEANGMSNGEIVACVLLKPLARAVADGDPIHAVIRGSAINNNANRSKSPYSPDSVTQAEVIRLAWKKAGVGATDIGFIEAHGSGTQLGDTLEVEGLDLAFGAETQDKKFCAISTVKSNAGHGMSGAGLFGVIKTVLQLKHREIYPTIHVDRLNPLIDFEKSAVFVNRELQRWEPRNGGRLLGGVTSLGASGTNVHMVLEEAPPRASRPAASLAEGGAFLVPLSARNERLLDEYRVTLREHLVRARPNLADVAHTLGRGRRHHGTRAALVVSSLDELISALDRPLDARPTERVRALWVLGDHADDVQSQLRAWGEAPSFARHVEACREYLDWADARAQLFALQYALYRILSDFGVSIVDVVPVGLGALVLQAATGAVTLPSVAGKIPAFRPLENVEARTKALLARVAGPGLLCCTDLSGQSEVSRALAAAGARIHDIVPAGKAPVPSFLAELYLAGHTLDWHKLGEHQTGARIELPPYPFEKTRCWLRDRPRRGAAPETSLFNDNEAYLDVKERPILDGGGDNVELIVASFWCEALDRDSVAPDASFFDLGGDSLQATKLIRRVNQYFGTDVAFEDIYEYPSVRALCGLLSRSLGVPEKVGIIWREVLQVPSVEAEHNFFDLGGHSLLANQIIVKIRDLIGVEVDFEEFFDHPTLGAFSAYVEQKSVPQVQKAPVP